MNSWERKIYFGLSKVQHVHKDHGFYHLFPPGKDFNVCGIVKFRVNLEEETLLLSFFKLLQMIQFLNWLQIFMAVDGCLS